MDSTKNRSGIVRRAGAADADALARIIREPMVAMHGDNATEVPRDAAGIALLELQDPRIDTLVVEAQDGLLGFLQLRWGMRPPSAGWMQGSVELRRHHVRTRHRGAGVALRLLEAAMETAHARQAVCIWLKVDKASPQAIGFYRKHGFRIAGTALFAEAGQCREHWVMHRVLAPCTRAHAITQVRSQSSTPPSTSTNIGCVSATASRQRA